MERTSDNDRPASTTGRLVPGEPPLVAFVSSAMDDEMKPAREIAFKLLGSREFLRPFVFENAPASPEPVDEDFLRRVRGADMVVWLVGTQTTDPVRNEIREALASLRPLLIFRLPVNAPAKETEALLSEVGLRAKWDRLVTVEDLAESLKLAISDVIARAVRGKPGLGRLALLDDQDRRSRARCIRRFLAVGVSQAVAETLTADSALGLHPQALKDAGVRPVTVLQGDVGAGKSLLMDRWFSQALSLLRESSAAPIPVFLEAGELSGPLRTHVEGLASGFGDPRIQGARVFIDGADEVPLSSAQRILDQGRELAFAWPLSSVTMATRASKLLSRPEEIVEIPALSEEEVGELVRRVYPHAQGVRGLFFLSPSLREALQRPLFALLLAVHLRDRSGRGITSKADLIRGFAENALRHGEAPPPTLEQILARLAVRSLDQDGAVAISEIGARAEIRALLESRLVVPDQADTVRFSLRIFAEWFGATALAAGQVDAASLVRDPERLERWRYALAVFLSAFSDAEVTRVFRPIVTHDPGFASEVLKEAIPPYSEEDGPPLDAMDSGRRIRAAMAAWFQGLGSVVTDFSFCGPNGGPQPLGVNADNGRLMTAWYGGSKPKPDVFPLPVGPGWPAFNAESRGFSRSSRPPRYSAWAWRWSLDDVVHELSRLVKARAFVAECEAYVRERTWEAVVSILGRGSLFRAPVPIAAIEAKMLSSRISDHVHWINSVKVDIPALRRQLAILKERGEATLSPPWPGPDDTTHGGRWIWSGFSPLTVLELTRGVYAGALDIYEKFVETWLKPCKGRLRMAATLPACLNGRIAVREGGDPQDHNPPSLCFFAEPLAQGNVTTVNFELNSSGFSREEYEAAWRRSRLTRAQTHPWLDFSYNWESLDKLYGLTPAIDLAYRWLAADLRATGLVE
jgi:hypothetical protein